MHDKTALRQVALRYDALYLDITLPLKAEVQPPTAIIWAFVEKLKGCGYLLSQDLQQALMLVPPKELIETLDLVEEVLGLDLNWAALVKGWDTPTDESYIDHWLTMWANDYWDTLRVKGARLSCGHLIPEGTFVVERYTGCPYCGKPFELATETYVGQASRLKNLKLWLREDMEVLLHSLLTSLVPLNATERNSLVLLLNALEPTNLPQVPMRETAILVVDYLMSRGRIADVLLYLRGANDVLRYLWYHQTGKLQILEPRTQLSRRQRRYRHWGDTSQDERIREAVKSELKLKYNRKTCWAVASCLNALAQDPEGTAEEMHPKRSMWVRFIRALRLGEYARRKGFERLAGLLDTFYKGKYTTYLGQLNEARLRHDADSVFALLRERPGVFARSLFATMLHFGAERTLSEFAQVAERLPSRLLLSLANIADIYLAPDAERRARPLLGEDRAIPPNQLLRVYAEAELRQMSEAVQIAYKREMYRRYALSPRGEGIQSVYIDPQLYRVPAAVGDRTTTLQDTSMLLQGTRFPIEGEAIRLFLHWGKGLSARHLDMDLSCSIALSNGEVEHCAYYALNALDGAALHSGDIRHIPDEVGTAEYIELSLSKLRELGARYVVFTCNAYSAGSLSPNLRLGFMDSAYPMTISEEHGGAYDPSCVQYFIRVGETDLAKGLVFGVLLVESGEVVWLEMPFSGQTIQSLDHKGVEAMLRRLEAKTSLGDLLRLRAEAQGLTLSDMPELADEVYPYEWALQPKALNELLQV